MMMQQSAGDELCLVARVHPSKKCPLSGENRSTAEFCERLKG